MIRGKIIKRCIWLFAWTSVLLIQSAHSAERIAFVVGNGDYKDIMPLANPVNDATDVAERLQALGFKLHGGRVHYNLDERNLLKNRDRHRKRGNENHVTLKNT